jgi:hypothetical protein
MNESWAPYWFAESLVWALGVLVTGIAFCLPVQHYYDQIPLTPGYFTYYKVYEI